jgi:hypothetical protein
MLMSRIDVGWGDELLFLGWWCSVKRKPFSALTTSGHSFVPLLSCGFREGILTFSSFVLSSVFAPPPLLVRDSSLDVLASTTGLVACKIFFVGSWSASGREPRGAFGSNALPSPFASGRLPKRHHEFEGMFDSADGLSKERFPLPSIALLLLASCRGRIPVGEPSFWADESQNLDSNQLR